MKNIVKLNVGDKVIMSSSGETGVVSRLCADEEVIYIRWDRSNTREMVKVNDLIRR